MSVTNKKKSSALLMAYNILSDKRNMNRYASTSMRNGNGEITADLKDAIDAVSEAFSEALKMERAQIDTPPIDPPCQTC